MKFILRLLICLFLAVCLTSCLNGSTTPTIAAGTLSVNPNESVITVGQRATAVVSLSGSVHAIVTVNIVSNNPNLVSVSPTNCTLSSESNQCTLTLNGLGAGSTSLNISATNYQSITESLNIRYVNAYITNYVANGYYTQCTVGANGIESDSCINITPQAPGALNGPTQMTIYDGFAYFTNYNEYSYTQCQVNAYGIESSTCNKISPSGNGTLNAPNGVAAANQYIYFSNSGNSSYTQCQVNANGIESSTCNTVIPTGSGALDAPAGITISGNYIYFTNFGISEYGTTYTQCTIGVNGIESSTCTKITPTGPLSGPQGIEISGGFAYFTNWSQTGSPFYGTSYTQCNVVADVIQPTTCTTITPTAPGVLSAPVGITIYNNIAYITNQGGNGNSYTQCNVGADGIIPASCNTITVPLLNAPQFITFY